MMIAGTFPNLPPIPHRKPTLGLVRRPEGHVTPSLGGQQPRAHKAVSKQRAWQIAQRAKGCCETCGKVAELGADGAPRRYCAEHVKASSGGWGSRCKACEERRRAENRPYLRCVMHNAAMAGQHRVSRATR